MLQDRKSGIRSFFEPKSVAVAGVSADPDKLGSIIFANLLENRRKGLLKASVYAVNPTRDRIGDQPCYPDVNSLPEVPELLVVSVPESQTVELIGKAAKAGVRAAIIVTSGYAEAGRADTEKEIARLASKSGMRVLGPNTIGIVDTWSGVDSLFLRPTKKLPDGSQVESTLKPVKGEIAVVSQSGHLAVVVAEDLAAIGLGVRALVGTGNQADVSVEDVIQYLADDEHTKVIAVYLEGVRDGRRFMEATAYATKKKPVVIFKVGKTKVGAGAALTHTASLVGDYEVYAAASRQAGVIEAGSLQELVDYSAAMLLLPKESSGKRTAIVTNAGGVGAIAADEAEKSGLRVEPFDVKVQRVLRSKFGKMPFIANSSLRNPVDLTATAPTEDFVKITEAVLALPEVDLGIVLPTHQTPAIKWDVAMRLSESVARIGKPTCAAIIGNSDFAHRIQRELIANGIPSFATPERAVRALAAAVSYAELSDAVESRVARPSRKRGLRGKGPMPAEGVSRLLRSYGIKEPKSVLVRNIRDLPEIRKLRYPVVCKLLSRDLLHKSDAGGVIAGVADLERAESALRTFSKIARRKRLVFDGMLVQETVGKTVELILGGTRDPTFGPVVVLGIGGTYTELVKDYALAVAPASPREVDRMISRLRLGAVLGGYRGGPKVDHSELLRTVSDFSRIMVENPTIEQMEVNPLMASGKSILAVDTRVILG